MDWLRLSLVIPLGADVIDKALDLRANDFEDALQYFSAVQAHADCLGAQGVRGTMCSCWNVVPNRTFLTY